MNPPLRDPHPSLVSDASMSDHWASFRAINERRRSIREFDGAAIADEVVRAVLAEGLLAPSSNNCQPYEIHWVRDPATKHAVAAACNGQRAAASASTLLVVVAGPSLALRTTEAQLDHLHSASQLEPEARAYHHARLTKARRFLRLAPSLWWAPLQAALALVKPALALLPIGRAGQQHWTARSSIYAAQTLLLAAAAHDLDACPMEGFSAPRVARLLGLPRGVVVPVVIALGRRRDDARVEPRWRRSFEQAVVVH